MSVSYTHLDVYKRQVMDTEKEQQAGDKAVAREEPNWQEIMKFMAEQFKKQEEQNKQTNEKIDSIQESLVNPDETGNVPIRVANILDQAVTLQSNTLLGKLTPVAWIAGMTRRRCSATDTSELPE